MRQTSPFFSLVTATVPARAGDAAILFKTAASREEYLRLYDELIGLWPAKPDQLDVETSFGLTHINAVGSPHAPALLLLPGFGANSTMWFANIGPLSRCFRVFAIDTLGQPGRSVPSKALKASDTSDWLGEVMDRLSLRRAHVAGVSLGGWIALDYAIRQPGRVERVAALDPAASFAPMSATFVLHSFIPIMVRPTRNGLTKYFRWLTKGKATDGRWGELMIQGILGSRSQPPIRATPFTDDRLRGCRAPVLLLVGEKSVIYDPEKAVRRAERFLPQVSAEIVADASHGLCYEQPDRINSRLIEFLRQGRSGENGAIDP